MLSRGGRAAAQGTPDSWGMLWNFLKDPKLFLPGVVEKVNHCWSRSLQEGRCPRVALWPLQWLRQALSWVIHVAGDSFLTQPPHFLRVFCESCPRVGLFYSVTDRRWVIHVPLCHCNQHRSSPSGTWTHSFLWSVLLCLWWIGGGVSLCLLWKTACWRKYSNNNHRLTSSCCQVCTNKTTQWTILFSIFQLRNLKDREINIFKARCLKGT